MSVFVPAQGIKTVHAGPRGAGGGAKKWQNSVHVVVEWLLIEAHAWKKPPMNAPLEMLYSLRLWIRLYVSYIIGWRIVSKIAFYLTTFSYKNCDTLKKCPIKTIECSIRKDFTTTIRYISTYYEFSHNLFGRTNGMNWLCKSNQYLCAAEFFCELNSDCNSWRILVPSVHLTKYESRKWKRRRCFCLNFSCRN